MKIQKIISSVWRIIYLTILTNHLRFQKRPLQVTVQISDRLCIRPFFSLIKPLPMKQLFALFFLLAVVAGSADAGDVQVKGSENKAPRRFWAGLSYTYVTADMKLYSRTEHAIWQALDYGERILTDDDISSINSIARFTSENNSLCLEAGMIMLDKPDSRWHIEGKVMFGLTKTKYETYDRNKESTDLLVDSPFSRISAGLGFMFGYSFNPHWGISASPYFIYATGTATDIDDQLNGPVLNFTEDRKEKSQTILSRVNLMASYRIGKFTFSAGPGFYLAYNNRTYTVDFTNPENGSHYYNDSRSVYYNKSFVDGCLDIEWRITPALGAGIFCGIGNDFIITPGFRFLF